MHAIIYLSYKGMLHSDRFTSIIKIDKLIIFIIRTLLCIYIYIHLPIKIDIS